jgi:hypothetical protein
MEVGGLLGARGVAASNISGDKERLWEDSDLVLDFVDGTKFRYGLIQVA